MPFGTATPTVTVQPCVQVLVYGLRTILALLHPLAPFVTERLWQALPHSGAALIAAPWPTVGAAVDAQAVHHFEVRPVAVVWRLGVAEQGVTAACLACVWQLRSTAALCRLLGRSAAWGRAVSLMGAAAWCCIKALQAADNRPHFTGAADHRARDQECTGRVRRGARAQDPCHHPGSRPRAQVSSTSKALLTWQLGA